MTDEPSLRERLIDVGVDLVMTEGSASLGLREIARRAGVSHGAPRRYFPTHHALLSAIAQRGFEDLGGRFAAVIAETRAPRAQLGAVGRAYVAYALDCRGMFELMFRHDLLDSEQHAAGERRLRESSLLQFERMVDLVARCQATRDAAPQPGTPQFCAPPEMVAAALWSNLHGIAQLWAWGSIPLALTPPEGSAGGDDQLEQLITAALDAHLGPVKA
ncbi:TetR/AcrR family transcriptional regulator [Streptomyces sp. NPDC050738]|uniref:TetR/AcrR family transcriptional regulator n=1 Tax=Streptomyces sp. NPDC050738 TaxID=3154744 RepID=UPI0034125A47